MCLYLVLGFPLLFVSVQDTFRFFLLFFFLLWWFCYLLFWSAIVLVLVAIFRASTGVRHGEEKVSLMKTQVPSDLLRQTQREKTPILEQADGFIHTSKLASLCGDARSARTRMRYTDPFWKFQKATVSKVCYDYSLGHRRSLGCWDRIPPEVSQLSYTALAANGTA